MTANATVRNLLFTKRVQETVWAIGYGAVFEIRSSLIKILHAYRFLNLFSAVPSLISSTVHAGQLVSLPTVGILNTLCSICNICLFIYN